MLAGVLPNCNVRLSLRTNIEEVPSSSFGIDCTVHLASVRVVIFLFF